MAQVHPLNKLGLLVDDDWLDKGLCGDLVRTARSLPWKEAPVFDGVNQEAVVDGSLRRTRRAEVPAQFAQTLSSALDALKPRLEEHFKVELKDGGYERPQLLRYEPGDFFAVHADGADHPDGYAPARSRKVSLSIYLNDPAGPEGYEGGLLVFYGLFPGERARRKGVPLRADAGLLAAFRSDVPHEVTEVTAGERYAIVTWWS